MNGRNSIKRSDRGHVGPNEGQDPHPGKFSRTHVVRVAPGAPLPTSPIRPPRAAFFSRIAFYVPPPFFRGPRIFFLPLGRPSAATEGAAKTQDSRGGVAGQRRGRRMRVRRRETTDEEMIHRGTGGRAREGGRRMENREEIKGAHHPGVMA